MRNQIIATSETLVTEDCIHCGVLFALPQDLRNNLVESHRDFYCPNGHRMAFTGKTEVQKAKEKAEKEAEELRRRLEYAQATLTSVRDQRDAAERSNRALKGTITKVKKRAGAGVCQWCKRSFPQLAEHVKTKHPNHAHEETVS